MVDEGASYCTRFQSKSQCKEGGGFEVYWSYQQDDEDDDDEDDELLEFYAVIGHYSVVYTPSSAGQNMIASTVEPTVSGYHWFDVINMVIQGVPGFSLNSPLGGVLIPDVPATLLGFDYAQDFSMTILQTNIPMGGINAVSEGELEEGQQLLTATLRPNGNPNNKIVLQIIYSDNEYMLILTHYQNSVVINVLWGELPANLMYSLGATEGDASSSTPAVLFSSSQSSQESLSDDDSWDDSEERDDEGDLYSPENSDGRVDELDKSDVLLKLFHIHILQMLVLGIGTKKTMINPL